MGSIDWPWIKGKVEEIEAWLTSLQSWGNFDRITVKRLDLTTGGTVTIDHGGLLGLTDDDHTIYLLANGTRNLTGNLTVSAGVTIDGVDISVHAANADAHHAGFIGLEDNAATAIVPAADDRIQLTDDGVINADASGNTIALSIAQGQIDHGSIGGLDGDDHSAVYPNFGDTETISGAWTFSNAIKADRADDARILEIYEGATQKWDIYRDPYDRLVFWDAVNEENKFHFGQSNNILLINMADNDVYCQLSGTPGDITWGVYNDPSNHGFIGSRSDIPFAIRQHTSRKVWITSTQMVINEDSADYDFRVESNGSQHALFVQGSDGWIGLGIGVPMARLHLYSPDENTNLYFTVGDDHHTPAVWLATKYDTVPQWAGMGTIAADGSLCFSTTGSFSTAGIILERDGDVLFNRGNVGINDVTPSFKLDVNGTGQFTGKLTLGGGTDPPYVLYDRETHSSIIERIRREVPPSKLGGAVLFFNSLTKRLEVFVPLEGKFYNLRGGLIEAVHPITETYETVEKHYLDEETGEVKSYPVPKTTTRHVLREGYELEPWTGKFMHGKKEVYREEATEVITTTRGGEKKWATNQRTS